MRQTVLVTGASRGIGRASVARLAAAEMRVVGTVRTPTDAESLEREVPGAVNAAVVDLADDDSIAALPGVLSHALGVTELAAVVHVAAAAGRAMPMAYVTREDFEQHLRVGATGAAVLTATLRPLLARPDGRIVYVGAGPLALPMLGAGFAAKRAMEAIADVTRVELAGEGIRVSVVEPGMTRWEDADAQLRAYNAALDSGVEAVPVADRARYRRAADAFQAVNARFLERGASADAVAARVEHAVTARRPRRRYYCGYEQKLAAALTRLAPSAVQDAVLRRMMRL